MNQRTIAVGIGVILLCVIFFFLFFNSKKENEIGGACSYDQTLLPATIIGIDTLGDQHFNLVLSVEFGDTLNYRLPEEQYSQLDSNIKDRIEIGTIIVYEEHEIIDGSCNPYYFIIRVEEYHNP